MKYFFGIFDPRPQGAEANQQLIAGKRVMGIEVTIPALVALCSEGNIDPQHGQHVETYNNCGGYLEGLVGGPTFFPGETAIEFAARQWKDTGMRPEFGTLLVTVRPDLDSIGAMAVFEIFAERHKLSAETLERISLIAQADKFAMGKWEQKVLPSRENPWPTGVAAPDNSELAAIAACIADFKLLPEARVEAMIKFLVSGEEPVQYREQVEKERQGMIAALADGRMKVETTAGGKIAVVESSHRAATTVGYSLAPVVIALNPAFRVGGGKPHKKFTICQYQTGYVDMKAVFAELSAKENGWGGSPTIGGSPQGVSSIFTIDEVVEVVKKHLSS